MADVLTRFLEQVELGPDRAAVCEGGQTITYAELAHKAARLAATLTLGGTPPKVLILLDQGWHSYAAMLAVMMVGGTYSPVNTQAPMARIALIASMFRPDTVITRKSVLDRFSHMSLSGRIVDMDGELPPSLKTFGPRSETLYVMFTSGSTGTPKGVVVRRDSLDHFIDWVIDAVQPTPDDRWSQHPNIAFDMSHLDIFGCLGSGGTLFPLNSRRDRLMPADAVRRHGLTLWYSVPSIIGLMEQAGQLTTANLASLRLLNFAGEALLPEQLERLFKARPDVEVWNTYGPTEATVTCTLRRFHADDFRNFCTTTASIGNAIPGMRLELTAGPSADEGEIVILGPQLATGYWENPALTQRAFRPIHVNGEDATGYFTGDWAKRIGDDIYFMTRIDDQVKVRGVRIELGEIETALRGCGFVDAVVILHGADLHAFLETSEPVDEKGLRDKLAATLLPQAIPSIFHALAQFPRNDNDKIDRGAIRRSLEAT